MKTFIKNRDGRKVCVVVEGPRTPGKLAFVMHGLGGTKNQRHIRSMIEVFLELGYTVVSFDTTNSFGESEGSYEGATITNYYADLEDVIAWASAQPWYQEPFVLCGHSLGGFSTAFFAEKHPEKVRALAPISTVVSGQLLLEAFRQSPALGDLGAWERDGVLITKSYDGTREKRLKWSHVEDSLRYNLLPKASKLTMPVLLVVGEKDMPTPLIHQQLLYDELLGPKELHVIKDAPHTFYEEHERAELKRLLKDWAQKL